MERTELKHLGEPAEVREFPKGRLETIKVGGATVGRAILEPGWRWVTSVQLASGDEADALAREAGSITHVRKSLPNLHGR